MTEKQNIETLFSSKSKAEFENLLHGKFNIGQTKFSVYDIIPTAGESFRAPIPNGIRDIFPLILIRVVKYRGLKIVSIDEKRDPPVYEVCPKNPERDEVKMAQLLRSKLAKGQTVFNVNDIVTWGKYEREPPFYLHNIFLTVLLRVLKQDGFKIKTSYGDYPHIYEVEKFDVLAEITKL